MQKLLIIVVMLASVSHAEIRANHPTTDEKVKYGENKVENTLIFKQNHIKANKKVKHIVKKDVMSKPNYPNI